MIFSFVFFYSIGALIFFCHTAIITAESTGILSSRMHLVEEEQEELFVNYFAKILFQTVMMTAFPISFAFYITINTFFSDILFVDSGLFTVIWLISTGILIKFVYHFATHNIKALKVFDYDKYFKDKEFFWITCPMLYGILFNLYDHTIFFTILAIVLGKYIWMDSFRLIPLSNIKIKVKNFFKKSKSNIHLLFCQAFVVGYLLVQWYPQKDEPIYMDDAMRTFLILLFFLMPVLDLFIFESMKSYAGFIITSRK
ncbi:MAG: hypothetical protein J6K48_07090 [Lachnospiraceae bacterium]|nr:hypothetical protein [Lachnospiraceae bacterium]